MMISLAGKTNQRGKHRLQTRRRIFGEHATAARVKGLMLLSRVAAFAGGQNPAGIVLRRQWRVVYGEQDC